LAANLIDPHAWFSVLRYRADATRDEARNVAVVLVNPDGTAGGIRAAPVSTVSPRLREQGIVDAVLANLEQRLSTEPRLSLEELQGLWRNLTHSLCLTEPKPVLAPDVNATLAALYRAYVAPTTTGSSRPTKSVVMDRVIRTMRQSGVQLVRSQYVGGFLFDLVIDEAQSLGEVLSFATGAAKWEQVENDAGHFLYGLQKVSKPGFAVIEPPPPAARESARESFARVVDWFRSAEIPVSEPKDLAVPEAVQEVLALT
jgi:hypothetical protein